ncbi:MAG: aminoglycoside phosphotransferase family protein [Candidatus Latescibacterota bacterium]|nr:MAG: aminoglycoside phosphotransferase family protein [Candidatus Latescibacterota bacterium]
MIRTLDTLLADSNRPGLPELRAVLAALLGETAGRARLLQEENLSRERVFRLRLQADDTIHSLVIKVLPVERARREQMSIRRWLPRLGFERHAPRLLGVAADRNGERVWHVYEDLPGGTLKECAADRDAVRAAIDLIARLQLAAVEQPLLSECRLIGQDLGPQFFAASVRDAMRGLQALRKLQIADPARREMVEQLLDRMLDLQAESAERTRVFDALDWPETLQHGDLWTTNVVMAREKRGPHAYLIDWDHAGVGPAIFDLSTLLRHFPPHDRAWILDVYRSHVARAKWHWPNLGELDFLFETAELARFANCVTWCALAATEDGRDAIPAWVFEDLADIDSWFRDLTPLMSTSRGSMGEAA